MPKGLRSAYGLSRTRVAGVTIAAEVAAACTLPVLCDAFPFGAPRSRVYRQWCPFRVNARAYPPNRNVVFVFGTLLDQDVVRHIVLHELCHFVREGHNRKFRALLAQATYESVRLDVRAGLHLSGKRFDQYCVEMRQQHCE